MSSSIESSLDEEVLWGRYADDRRYVGTDDGWHHDVHLCITNLAMFTVD